ncbi:hypothetical protein THRCLA_07699 [Thraustotheca clavata]|uniref:Secreted protein n=1 Tax=Thraustotheca clavata TaxID=74557 RepID=A0A1V9ZCI8_9STRA|nr:hypothetical protein THRCLA_07699 [Thraustotheca clavata]
MRCVFFFLRLLMLVHGQYIGNGLRYVSDTCEALKEALDIMAINGDQLVNGIVGGQVVESDCTKLRKINVMDYHGDDGQDAICVNSCYNATASTFAQMINNDCFQGNDDYEVANQRLYAASFQFACQRYASSKYCVTLIAQKVSDAGTSSDICGKIIDEIDCCFESYRRYMSFGTQASIAQLNYIQKKCGVGSPCSCGYNAFATNISNVYICSSGIIYNISIC